MITKRVIVIIKNVITLIHYGLKYLAIRALEVLRDSDTLRNRSTSKRSISKEYHNSFKKSLDYLDKPRYISTDYEDNMEYYNNPKSEVKISKWDKKSAPYCETP